MTRKDFIVVAEAVAENCPEKAEAFAAALNRSYADFRTDRFLAYVEDRARPAVLMGRWSNNA